MIIKACLNYCPYKHHFRFTPHERAKELNKNGYFFSNIVIPCVSAWWGRALPFWWWIFILDCQPYKRRNRWYTGWSWIMHGVANRFETCIRMINSPPRHCEVMICSNRLVLGHAHELHMFIKTITPRVRNNKQTAVTKMWKTALLEKLISFSLTFRMLRHSSSEVTID